MILLLAAALPFLADTSLETERTQFSADAVNWRSDCGEILFSGHVRIHQADRFAAEGAEAILSYTSRDPKASLQDEPKPTESPRTSAEEFHVESLVLKGRVLLRSLEIQDKEGYALADSLEYLPGERKWVLRAEPSKRVLFWQDDVRLSAGEVHIAPDPLTGEDLVWGVGDVHLSFTVEEESAIQELIQKLSDL